MKWEVGGSLLWEHKSTLHGALEISVVGNLRQVEYLERLRFHTFVEDRDPHLAAGIKAGSLRDFLTARGLLKGQGLHRACCLGERTGGQNCPGTLCPAGWELSGASGAPSL